MEQRNEILHDKKLEIILTGQPDGLTIGNALSFLKKLADSNPNPLVEVEIVSVSGIAQVSEADKSKSLELMQLLGRLLKLAPLKKIFFSNNQLGENFVDFFMPLTSLKKLQVLHLPDNGLNNQVAQILKKRFVEMTALESLSLDGNPELVPELSSLLGLFKDAYRLEELSLNNMPLGQHQNEKVFREILDNWMPGWISKPLIPLKKVHLNRCQFNAKHINWIYSTLFRNPNIVSSELSLKNNDLGNESLRFLANIIKFRATLKLHLQGNQFTQEGIKSITSELVKVHSESKTHLIAELEPYLKLQTPDSPSPVKITQKLIENPPLKQVYTPAGKESTTSARQKRNTILLPRETGKPPRKPPIKTTHGNRKSFQPYTPSIAVMPTALTMGDYIKQLPSDCCLQLKNEDSQILLQLEYNKAVKEKDALLLNLWKCLTALFKYQPSVRVEPSEEDNKVIITANDGDELGSIYSILEEEIRTHRPAIS